MLSIVLYLTATSSCYLLNFIKQFNKGVDKPIFRIFYLIMLALFLCFGYMTGSDWRQYESSFYYDFPIIKEPGLVYVYQLAKILKIDFWPIFIGLKIFCFASFILFLKTISKKHFWLTLSILIPKMLLFLFIDNPMRNLIAMSFFWLSYISFIKGKKLTTCFLLICSISFHYSTICVLLALSVLILKKLINKYFKTALLVILIIYSLLCSQSFLFYIFNLILKFLGIGRGLNYFSGLSQYANFTLISPTIILSIIEFCFIVYHRRILNSNSIYSNMFCVCLVHFLLLRLANSISILSRLSYYTTPIFTVTFVNLLSIYYGQKKWLAQAIKVFIVLFSLALTINIVLKDYKSDRPINAYLPYTNYIVEELIMDKNLSFSNRDTYNRIIK